ncbi:hypothetical protein T11_7693 [Trichinella zimbabwensis]|uniref:Uncharacterized protein n=1 Tax=Trichinella zimbabwensis TaxID=268475 RepID=A0A0V1HTL3_9BILA|nr:hypothetical protein T11_7693 [Trichinella zimbabwensis]
MQYYTNNAGTLNSKFSLFCTFKFLLQHNYFLWEKFVYFLKFLSQNPVLVGELSNHAVLAIYALLAFLATVAVVENRRHYVCCVLHGRKD